MNSYFDQSSFYGAAAAAAGGAGVAAAAAAATVASSQCQTPIAGGSVVGGDQSYRFPQALIVSPSAPCHGGGGPTTPGTASAYQNGYPSSINKDCGGAVTPGMTSWHPGTMMRSTFQANVAAGSMTADHMSRVSDVWSTCCQNSPAAVPPHPNSFYPWMALAGTYRKLFLTLFVLSLLWNSCW